MSRFIPRSLRGRFVLIMIIGVFTAQLLSYVIWSTQVRASKLQLVDEVSRSVAYSIASTVRFFRSLPLEYRHIVLDQLRNMGGTRFFVSVNDHRITVIDIGDGGEKELVVRNVHAVLGSELGVRNAVVEFSRPDNLRVFNDDVLLMDLPSRWAHYSLLLEPLSPPILVVQMELEPGAWLYVATLLPVPDLLGELTWLSGDRLLALLLVSITVLGLSLGGIRWVTRPLARIAHAATGLAQDLERPPLPETGPREIVSTARAFNHMQNRIRRQVEERERLFSAISHDLKTPITRLRLRAEMLEDPALRERFAMDLEELHQLVQGALASVKGVDLHEDPEWLSPRRQLQQLAADFRLRDTQVTVHGDAGPIRLRPLAMKRCLTNLLENAVFYGRAAEVCLEDAAEGVTIRILDQGPGIPAAELERVFEPYVRLERSRSRNTGGSGLGLGIARHIVHGHGGSLTLKNRRPNGLEARVFLPREHSITAP
ncbi:MAG: ATP-binding protein [Aquisalimonadaceae bacterium]